MSNEIPLTRPLTPLLDRVTEPSDLRTLAQDELETLAGEVRDFLLWSVGQTGGHFGAGLGVVELTIALHYCFDTPRDRIVWDVGHQAYPHKILTGRRERMLTMRQAGGLAPFPQRDESPYDTFGVGHSSTSISAALGMALAARMQGEERRAVAVIGDGAMTAGMAFEALNHAADTGVDLLVILNDNAMSISHNVGGLSRYFARILASRFYASVRAGGKRVLSRLPPMAELARRTEEHMKGLVLPGTLFEELGFNYIGPVHGHDLEDLVATLRNVRDLKGPQFLHVVTQKGRGYEPAERNPVGLHSLTKIEPPEARVEKTGPNTPKYSNVFGTWLVDIAELDDRVVGITPAMSEGSDLVAFSERFPDRYHDVAIAEQHAVTLAAGLACEGAKPVVAIYSTFLQRAYDQLIHDVAIQNLDVLFALDRSGVVEDGQTHSGIFDLSFLRCIPNMIVMAPSDETETRQMLYTGHAFEGPAAVRYPRGRGPGADIVEAMTALPIGKGEVLREGSGVALLAFGSMVGPALVAGEELDASVVNMRFVKPLDLDLIAAMAARHGLLVTLEENVIAGGAGSGVNEALAAAGLNTPILNLGLPDRFPLHGDPDGELAAAGLDAEGIVQRVRARLGVETPLAGRRESSAS
ncbi:MAG TPA: 1-deoxy-D-xylulose-5-phosphate synthase [Pseudomonadales bacterium]|nr:1-deoxy-D-xylulose-5-phosphate synthase [Pseudomonadales bacterium]